MGILLNGLILTLEIFSLSQTYGLSYAPRSSRSSQPGFELISDDNVTSCQESPGIGHLATRLQSAVSQTWTDEAAEFTVAGHYVGCHPSSSEKLYMAPLTSAVTGLSANRVMNTCTLISADMDGTLEICLYSCHCTTTCTHVYMVHHGVQEPVWKLCSFQLLGVGDCLSSPCLNNGTCTSLGGSYTCICLDGYTGINCETNFPRVRLANGANQYEGRVEFLYGGVWGTVCDDKWQFNISVNHQVVCQQLGYTGGVYFPDAYFGQGVGDIWLDDVECTGDEQRLEDCPHLDIGVNNCGHDEDVSVRCDP